MLKFSCDGLTPTAIISDRRKAALLVLAVLLSLVLAVAAGIPAQAAVRADMAITVSDDPDPVTTNHNLSYHVEVSNRGPGTATAVEVTAALPDGGRFEPLQSDPACSESAGIVTCGFPSWDANAVRLIVITVVPTTVDVLQVTFTVSATERDSDLSNNSETEETAVAEPTEADVSVNVPSSAAGYAGELIWLGIEVRNAGPATATGLTVALDLPRGLSPSFGTSQCTETSSGLSCLYSFGSLPPGAGSAMPVGLTASDAGTYAIHGSVSADQPDPVVSNNSDSAVVNVSAAADLSVQIHESADPAAPGKTLTYSVTVTNHGPSPASAVNLTDTWSTTVAGGVRLISFGVTQGECVLTGDMMIECQLGGLVSGATATATVRLRPQGTGSVIDQAQVSAAEFDRDTADNIASEMTTVGSA